jgi:hypothetical protein
MAAQHEMASVNKFVCVYEAMLTLQLQQMLKEWPYVI